MQTAPHPRLYKIFSQLGLQIYNIQRRSNAASLKDPPPGGQCTILKPEEKSSSRVTITQHRGCVNFPPSPRALRLILFSFLTAGKLLFFSSVFLQQVKLHLASRAYDCDKQCPHDISLSWSFYTYHQTTGALLEALNCILFLKL